MELRNKLMRLSLAFATLVGSWDALAQTPDSQAWSTSDAQNVSTIQWTTDQISTFVTSAIHSDSQVSIGDFAFADLLGDGRVELVASVDYSGRAFFNKILIIQQSGAGYSVQTLPALNVHELSEVLVDLNSDGNQELLIPTPLTPYLGGSFPQAKWITIYGWSGSIYLDRSEDFSGYYIESILPALQKALDNAKLENNPLRTALAQLEYDKARRVATASDSDYGIETAQALANNSDSRIRIWAAAALADIGSPAALATLEILMRDYEPEVANYAKSAQSNSQLKHCERINISILDTINLSSNKHVRVAIPIPPSRSSERKAFDIKSVKFGGTGLEDSLVSCNNGSPDGIICLFRASHTGLQVGDGVATLRAYRPNGSCVIGQDAMRVVSEGNP